MKIALVHDWLTGMRGGEKCLEILCRRFPDARLYTLLHCRGRLSPAIERMEIATSFLQRVPFARRHYRYLLPLMPRAIESFELPADLDLVVSLSHAVAKGIRAPAGVPHVCYCFTPMRYAWDLRSQYFGDDSRSQRRWSPRAALGRLRNRVLDRVRDWDRAASDRVGRFVAISRTIAERIAACYGRPSTIVYPPVDVDFYTPSSAPREEFYVCVSALVPYKRIDLAVQACHRLGRRLVVIGSGPEERRLKSLAGDGTQFLGWQSDESIRDHLRRCRALVFPGHEDFGIVPVEAQACGTAVLAYSGGGATETVMAPAGGRSGTGMFFETQSVESLIETMQAFEANPGAFDATLARRRAESFHASRFEKELVAILEATARRQASVRRAA